ncbi:hypothetical protein J4P02_01405 [Pseudomonas sp. NFXW11]
MQCIEALEGFLDRVYLGASRSQGRALSRNRGHYEYPGEKFCAYVSIFPHEVELVFEGERLEGGTFVVNLDLCTPDGEILAGTIVSARGSCGEVEAVLGASEALVLIELLRLLEG